MPPKFAEIEEKTEPWSRWFITAYFDISKDRPQGFGASSIPWTSINNYLIQHDFEGSVLHEARRILLNMDDHVVAKENKKDKNGNLGTVREKDAPAGA